MLRKIKLKHFKCFEEYEINFRSLTVFAGSNSVGKSSIIQALLLARISVDKLVQYNLYSNDINEIRNIEIPLNGKYHLSLGNSKEILTRDVGDNLINIDLYESDNDFLKLEFRANDNKDDVFNIELSNHTHRGSFDILKDELYYLNAERIGPRLSYDVEDLDYTNVGWQGEYAIQVISQKGEDPIEGGEKRKHPEVLDDKLINQVRGWMKEIIPGFYLDNAILEGQFKKAHTTYSKSSPPNVGFGISYVLPIVVNALIAKEGKLLIVENPEAHLHPKGQSQLGRFLFKMAHSGVQVIIETHSEHVINGMRVASSIYDINPESILINFFTRKEDSKVNINEILAKKSGDLSKFPRDFFDQVNQDMAEIFTTQNSR